nr:hypothetical protein [Tanacetum cinerariifolium]
MLPIELTNEGIRNSDAYKEYYAVATEATPPNTKASVWKTRSSSDTTVTPPPTADTGPRLTTSKKGKQAAKASKANSLSALFEKSTDEEGDDDDDDKGDDGDDGEEGDVDDDDEEGNEDDDDEHDDDDFDPIPKTHENIDDEGIGEENLGTNVGREEGHDKEEEEDELYKDVNINLGRGIQMTQEFEDSHVTLTPVNPDGQQ